MTKIVSWIAIAFGGTSVLALMIVSVVDSVSRAIGAPVLGAKELSEVLLVLCVGAALPLSILGGRSISIDGLVQRFPMPLMLAVTWAGVALSILSTAILGYSLIGAGFDARDFEESSALLLIPYFPLYLYLAAAHAVAALAFALYAVRRHREDGAGSL